MAKLEKKVYIDPLLRKDSRGVFSIYRNRSEIGDEMIKDFMDYDLNKNPDGFLLRNGETKTGVISQCYGLLTLMEYAKFNINLTKYSDVIEKINLSFNYILDKVVSEDGKFIFDATPFLFDETISNYIETAALFIKVLIEVRALLFDDYKQGLDTIVIDSKFVAKLDESDNDHTAREIKFVEELLVKAIDFITDAALLVNGDDGIDYRLNGSDIVINDADGTRLCPNFIMPPAHTSFHIK